MNALTFLDLFCGCGGFTLGMQRAGFRCLAAIDFNAEAISTIKMNLPDVEHPLERDLSKYTPAALAELIGQETVDVIVGGPPCQGFSSVRQVDAANHGPRVRRDKRRYLFRYFLDYVGFFRPRAFTMENVPGLQSAAKGKFFTLVQAEARRLGYCVHAQLEESWTLGVPQKRRRQLIFGVRNDLPGYFPSKLKAAERAGEPTCSPTLWDAIGDLPEVPAGGGQDECDYDLQRREQFLAHRGERARHYLEHVVEVTASNTLTAHRARPHSNRDLTDFRRLHEGETAAQAIARGEKMEFPYDRTVFKDRYTRQHRDRLCSTIVAHLAKDGLMFIHPIQNRTLTPREAARVQSFPDWFRFPKARTHAFRLVGNAIPPLVAEAIGWEVKEFLERAHSVSPADSGHRAHEQQMGNLSPDPIRNPEGWYLPSSITEAVRELEKPCLFDRRSLRSLSKDEFLRAWHAFLFVFPSLHPDNALDHGTTQEAWPEAATTMPGLKTSKRKRFVRSGWPVPFVHLGREGWRRYERGEMSDDAFYCVDVQRAGLLALQD